MRLVLPACYAIAIHCAALRCVVLRFVALCCVVLRCVVLSWHGRSEERTLVLSGGPGQAGTAWGGEGAERVLQKCEVEGIELYSETADSP
jgi:hypothetical protein